MFQGTVFGGSTEKTVPFDEVTTTAGPKSQRLVGKHQTHLQGSKPFVCNVFRGWMS